MYLLLKLWFSIVIFVFRGDSYTQFFTFLSENLQGHLEVAGRDDTHNGQLNAPWKGQMTSTLRQHQPGRKIPWNSLVKQMVLNLYI